MHLKDNFEAQGFKVYVSTISTDVAQTEKGETCVFWDNGFAIVEVIKLNEDPTQIHRSVIERIKNGKIDLQEM